MSVEHFGAKLKELRNAAGMTQSRLAEIVGFSLGGLADLESGRRNPTWETVLKLAKALGVKCEAFEQPPATETEKKPAKKKGKKK